jgi:hypothetical protein
MHFFKEIHYCNLILKTKVVKNVSLRREKNELSFSKTNGTRMHRRYTIQTLEAFCTSQKGEKETVCTNVYMFEGNANKVY